MNTATARSIPSSARATGMPAAEASPLPRYRGKKGMVQVEITNHCRIRFRQRYRHAFPKQDLPADIDAEIARLFNSASRVTNLGQREKTRMDRYGKDTLYFRTGALTFVVQDASILTVELSDSGLRHLNRGGPGSALHRVFASGSSAVAGRA